MIGKAFLSNHHWIPQNWRKLSLRFTFLGQIAIFKIQLNFYKLLCKHRLIVTICSLWSPSYVGFRKNS